MGIDPRGLAQAMGYAEARLNAVRSSREAMRDLLLSCRHVMVVSMHATPHGTDWRHMIKAIDELTGYEPTSAGEQRGSD